VDFCCPKAQLLLEIDGSQYCSDEMVEADNSRDEHLKNLGPKLSRLTDMNVLKNINGGDEKILEYVAVDIRCLSSPCPNGGAVKTLSL
jgi:very-short-patch-repair endonuclease